MKCSYCGFEHEENLVYCPHCGRQIVPEVPAISLNPMADRVSNVFNDGLFLVICILMSAYSVLTLFSGNGIPVFETLFTIFLWLGFAQGKRGFVSETHLRNLSGTVFAFYIVQYVCAGLFALLGLLCSALFGIISNSSYLFKAFMDEVGSGFFAKTELFDGLLGVVGGIFLVVFLIIAAVVILINIFGVRKIHKFLQSLYQSVEYNENRIVCAKAARTWLIVLGSLGLAAAAFSLITVPVLTTAAISEINEVFSVPMISGATAVFSVVITACRALCGIFAGVLINKYLVF